MPFERSATANRLLLIAESGVCLITMMLEGLRLSLAVLCRVAVMILVLTAIRQILLVLAMYGLLSWALDCW